jgi:hypothetical protein
VRIEVSTSNLELSPVLRRYAEGRVWLALQRLARRPSWVGVRIVGRPEDDRPTRVVAQVDAWLRGVGLVTVLHVDTNPWSGIDSAAV